MLNNPSVPVLDFYKKFNIPAVPWEIFEFLQQEQNKERSRFLINNHELISWVYDCLLGHKNPADKTFPLSEKDISSIQIISPSLYQVFDQWIDDLRFSLQMTPQKAISKEGYVFDCLVGNYNPMNENIVKILYLTNYFCPCDIHKEGLIKPVTIINIDKETLKDFPFNFSIDNELCKRKVFSNSRDSFLNGFSKNLLTTDEQTAIDRTLFPSAAMKEQVLPLVNGFLFNVPDILKKYIFGTMILSAYERNFPRVEDVFNHFEKMPLKFISTDKTIRTFYINTEKTLVEIKTDQEALNIVETQAQAEQRAIARPQYDTFPEPEKRPSPRPRMR